MIELTRLNGASLVINSDLIQYAESAPDTTLTLIGGEKVLVRESPGEVIDLTVAYRGRVMGEAARQCPGGMLIASAAMLRSLGEPADRRSPEIAEANTDAASRRQRTES